MRNAILTRKVGMTQVFNEKGLLVPVTVLEAKGGNTVLQIKTKENDGYSAYQLGFESIKDQNSTKAVLAHCKKANSEAKRCISEVRCKDITLNVGDVVNVDMFKVGDFVDASGTAIGKGYAGPIKLNNQHRGPMGHGSKYHRGVGSMGAIAPNRVFKGKRMPSHMGAWKRTVQNLSIVDVIPEKNLILVKGNVPGPKKGLVFVKASLKKSA